MRSISCNFLKAALCFGLVAVAWPSATAALTEPTTSVAAIAAGYRAHTIDDDPVVTYYAGLPPAENDRFADRTPEGLASVDRWKREALNELHSIDPASLSSTDMALFEVLEEQLEAELQLRVCRAELWNINHFIGWQAILPVVAENQPIETTEERTEALTRWASLSQFVETEISNLNRGLAEGYSAPKSVVARVIAQLETLVPSNAETSPLLGPIMRSNDPDFGDDFMQVAEQSVYPAIRRFRLYLENDYLPQAREGVALADLPNGRECYQAMLRANTTLNRTPEEVYALGQRTVETNLAAIREIGRRYFGTTDIAEIVQAVRADPDNQFSSQEELLSFSRARVANAKNATAELVTALPGQDVVVEPEGAADEAAGVSSHYDPNGDPALPATYRIQLSGWETQSRGEATIVAVHETWPGHHLQIAAARQHQPENPLGDLVGNAAYIEGWARYAEALAEEVGLYESADALILRRIWPARGMVVDPGLHVMGWSRQQAIDYLVSTGRFDEQQADGRVDRIAVLPGQLTSYDSGGLEIMALRQQAETALGPRFDLKTFNDAILAMGVIPLSALRRRIEGWIANQ